MTIQASKTVSTLVAPATRMAFGVALLITAGVGCSAELEGDSSEIASESLVDGVASRRTGDGVLGIATPKGGGAYSNACTASLVSDRVVLTAAHCVIDSATNKPKAIFIYDGESIQKTKWSTTVSATDVQAYPGYDVRVKPNTAAIDTWQDDIAVIVLPEAAPSNIRRLPLAEAGETKGYAIGATVRMTGYGSTSPSAADAYVKRTGSGVIAEARARTVTLSKTETTASGCGGDSGGPIQARDASARVLGVASFVSNPGDVQTCRDKTHYMRVSAYRPFIDGAIKASGGGAAPAGTGGSPSPAPAPSSPPKTPSAECPNGEQSSHQCVNSACTCSIGGTRADGKTVTKGQRCTSDEACETECAVCR